MSKQKSAKARKQTLADSLGKATKHCHSGEGRNPVTYTLDIWTGALLKKATTGRGSNGKISAHGIQKLRELILELAVRGKLVPQDPNDEPAGVLLEKIAKEKERLIKEGELKRQKKLPVIRDEQPYVLPENWEWVRLGNITSYGVTEKAEPGDLEKDVWVLELEDVEKGTSRLLKRTRYSERPFKSSKNRFVIGDVLYGKLRPYLDKVLVADKPGVCTTEIIPIRSYGGFVPEYLRLLLKSPSFIRYANESTHGMNLPRLGTDKARLALIPVAPLSEQHRIVAKVEELMALCDQLEQQQTDSIEAHQILVETVLAALVRPTARDGGSEENAGAIFFDHFDILFTTEHSIDQLKQTILQLAVMGKLVPHDPNDEPASLLLEKIAEEKARLVKEGKIKKQKVLPDLFEDEKPFYLPDTWEWVRFGVLIKSFTNGLYKKSSFYSDSGVVSLRMYNIQDGKIDFSGVRRVNVTDDELKQYSLEEGDLLINRVNSKELVGKAALIPEFPEPLLFESMNMRAKPFSSFLHSAYLNLHLKTDMAKTILLSHAKEAISQASLNQGQVSSLPMPLPPKGEQSRIVAKVDELMALCDTLKARLQGAQTTRVQLADAVVEQAVA